MQAPDKIELKDSPIHGRGVFARDSIMKGDTLEECHYFQLDDSNFKKLDRELSRYVFDKKGKLCVVMGLAMCYNHSLDPLADWRISEHSFRFFALRDIREGEEITIDYANFR